MPKPSSYRVCEKFDPLGNPQSLEVDGDVLVVSTAARLRLTSFDHELLGKHGFEFDSSLMGTDVPYSVRVGERRILELPVTWLLDDWEQFAYSAVPQVGGVIEEPDKVFRLWKAEFDALYQEGRYFMLTMHPELIGRASRIAMLDALISHMKQHDDVWFCTPQELLAAWKDKKFATQDMPY